MAKLRRDDRTWALSSEVDFAVAKTLAGILTAAGDHAPRELDVRDDEGHGFVKPENRIAAYRAIERLLATHLGGRAER